MTEPWWESQRGYQETEDGPGSSGFWDSCDACELVTAPFEACDACDILSLSSLLVVVAALAGTAARSRARLRFGRSGMDPLRAPALAAARLSRCRRGTRGGDDPVPRPC